MSSALARFKQLLVPGARFKAEFPPWTVRGNLETVTYPGKTVSRAVVRVTSHAVYFEDEDHQPKTFTFPAACQMVEKDGSFVYQEEVGKPVVTYTPEKNDEKQS